jgi:hypothetical protein
VIEKHDKNFERLLEGSLRGAEREPAADCPDVELLAAHFERKLSSSERATVDAHLPACPRCRAVVFDLARLSEPPRSPSLLELWRRWTPAFGALATATVAVVLAIRFFPETQEARLGETAKTSSELQAPESPPAATDYRALPTRAAPAKEAVDSLREKKVLGAKQKLERDGYGTAAKPAMAPPASRADDDLGKDRARPAEEVETRGNAAELRPELSKSDAARAEPPKAQEGAAARNETLDPEEPRAKGSALEQERIFADELSADRGAAGRALESAPAPAAGAVGGLARAPERERAAAGQPHGHGGEIPRVLWRIGPSGTIERSEDHGATWSAQVTGASEKLLAVIPITPTVVWAVGERGTVLRTLDGKTWTRLARPTDEDLIAVQAESAEAATVLTRSGRAFETRESGATWQTR